MSTFGRLHAASSLDRELLSQGWQLCNTAAGHVTTPQALQQASVAWIDSSVPATAASSLRQIRQWSLDSEPRNFDADDWWYRLVFTGEPAKPGEQISLCFGGLATVADVWFNGEPLLHSENMFRSTDCDVSTLLRTDNEILIRFAALEPLLAMKKPRPRWKAPMIQHQQLRWLRTTVLGRTPGWSPPAAAVGPWREIWLERRHTLRIDQLKLHTVLKGDSGFLRLSCQLIPLHQSLKITRCELRLTRATKTFTTQLLSGDDNNYQGELIIKQPDLWWPHTHGDPALYKADLRIVVAATDAVEKVIDIDLGPTGFRKITLDSRDGNFALAINDVPIFCRGACWTPPDVVTLDSSPQQLEHSIRLVREAGMNMLRIGGTMVYENDEFLDLCDVNGILLWQDFMFANMDYPETAEFVTEVTAEISQQINRLIGRPCLAVLCGNSEGEQQAAMFGATRDRWSPALFHQTIPALLEASCADIPYWPSSAHGGSFPHQNNVGTTSYYGVGAYLRPLEDARRSAVRFATECLAFANIPEDSCIEKMPGGLALKIHHPQWKTRTPRDLGAGWDFEDVRDHYLKLLFNVDPLQLRYADHDRYLELSRIVSGEVMAASFSEWRNANSACQGALVWFLRDLWDGAGWGLLDADGVPKTAYHYLHRALQPLAISISDEGCNGLYVHLINDRPQAFSGTLELAWYHQSETLINKTSIAVHVAAHTQQQLPVLQLLEYFTDLNHAYRFGPANCDLVVASLRDADAALISDAYYWPLGRPAVQQAQLGLEAHARIQANGDALLTVSTRKFAQSVSISVDGYTSQQQYFHLAPDSSRTIHLSKDKSALAFNGHVKAINGTKLVNIELLE